MPDRAIHVADLLGASGVGAMGARLVVVALERAGIRAVRVVEDRRGAQGDLFGASAASRDWAPAPSAIFVSAITPRSYVEWPRAARSAGVPPRAADRAPDGLLVAWGGQACSAPAPILDFADVVALGDGEVTAVEIARIVGAGATRADAMTALRGRDGYSVWPHDPLSLRRVEGGAPPVVATRAGEIGPATLELARGCKSRCTFCPIGWAGGTYREADRGDIEREIVRLRGRPINLYAPDYSAVSWAGDADESLAVAGCTPKGRDARADVTLRRMRAGQEPPGVKAYSFGLEGLSERLRAAIGKPLSHGDVVALHERLEAAGNRNVKWYLIGGFPGERDADLDEGLALVQDVMRVYTGSLTLTYTLLQPVPHTPLQWIEGHYPEAAAERGRRLISALRAHHERTGRVVLVSIPKGAHLHEHDVMLGRGARDLSDYLLALDARRGWISSGRWRDLVDPEPALRALDPSGPLPWSGVDVGTDPAVVRRAWDVYQRRYLSAEVSE